MKYIAFVVLFLVFSVQAGSQVGQIEYVLSRASDGLVYFKLSGEKTNSPVCASNDYWMIKDENSEAGKSNMR